MKATDDLQKMEIKLGKLAVLDYRAVVLPFVKSLLQVHAPEFDESTYISPESLCIGSFYLFSVSSVVVGVFVCVRVI